MTPSAASHTPQVRPARRSPYSGPTQIDSSRTSGVVQVMGSTDTTAAGTLAPTLRRPSEALVLPIRFTASGADYFRIWIVNVLLTLLTLSLYRPWARVRTLRYFYSHVRIDRHPLDFHGDPWRMLRGHVLVGLLLIGSAAVPGLPLISRLSLAVMALLWPALFRAALQFRLGHTSWRGLRFAFVGSARGAYLPFVLPGALMLGITVGTLTMPADAQPLVWAVAALVAAAGAPCFLWLLKSYQHDHLSYGQYRAELRAGVGSFYGVFFRALPGLCMSLGILGVTVPTVARALFGSAEQALLYGRQPPAGAPAGVMGRLGLFLVLLYAVLWLAQVPVRAHFNARLQDLLWSRTGTRIFRFRSELPPYRLMRVMFVNAVLTLLTLGLYHPFAKVAVARVRLEAISLVSRTSLDELVSFAAAAPDDVAGDAAGDLLGFDLGM